MASRSEATKLRFGKVYSWLVTYIHVLADKFVGKTIPSAAYCTRMGWIVVTNGNILDMNVFKRR
jgi:hypothetical protein